MKIEDGTS